MSCDACAITVPALPSYCKQHGVYKLDKQVYTVFVAHVASEASASPSSLCSGLRITGSWFQILLEERFFLNLNGAPFTQRLDTNEILLKRL